MTTKESLQNVDEAVNSRQKPAKKRSLYVINEHFRPIFEAEMATQVVSQKFSKRLFLFQISSYKSLLAAVFFGLLHRRILGGI